jgi:type I restriction enzyme S subunit
LSELTVPSIRKEKQRHIIARLKAQLAEVDKARQAAETQLAETERLRTVLLNKLFTTSENCKPIGFASKVQSGFAFKSQDFSPSGVRLLRNANVTPGEIRWSDVVYLPLEKSKGYGSYSIREGDVIISLDRPIISSGIKVARVTSLDSPSLLVQRVGRFLLDESLLDADYLYVFLQTDRFKEAISGHEQSLGVPHISPGQVEAVETPLPPLAVQQRIGLIAKEVLATTEEARRAAMSMLADISMLPERLLANAFDFAE